MEITAMEKGPYYFILADEISKASDTESQCSLQNKETDFVIDTSDTETVVSGDFCIQSEIKPIWDFPKKLPNNSSCDSEDLRLKHERMIATTESVTTSRTATDVESSSSLEDGTLITYNACIRCKISNIQYFPECTKCFQEKKKSYPLKHKIKLEKKEE
ncbi:hypothetical protein ABEB36_015801 [Hypothenemus hampei]|uniref:Uncharacterized protein n=1 Tax=Hypothenemus hampei TaxID=57062 RepID=A0ABD1DZL5_HYPHA